MLTQLKLDTKITTQINDAQHAVQELQQHLFLVSEQLFKIQAERDELAKKIQTHDDWERQKAHYLRVELPGGAFVYKSVGSNPTHFACTRCLEAAKLILTLQLISRDSSGGGYYECPHCRQGIPYRRRLMS